MYEWNFAPQYSIEESFTVEENNDGEIIGLEFTVGTVNGTTGDYTSEVYSTSIDIETDADRELVMDWMDDPVDGQAARRVPNAQGVTEPPQQDATSLNALEELLYERGVTSHEVHSGVGENGGWGLKGKILGVGGGYGQNSSSSEEQLEESSYLAASDHPGGTREFQSNPSC